VASRRRSRREQFAAVAAVLLMQLVGMVVLGLATLVGWDCLETGTCSEASWAAVVIAAIGLAMLYGGFVARTRTAKLERPVLTGIVLVALVALVPEGQPSSPAEDRTAT
jgi:hypothetical protein